MNKQNQFVFVLGLILLFIICPVKTNAMSIVTQSDQLQVDIVIRTDATRQEKTAANQLTLYLGKIYPAYQFSVTNAINENNRTIRLGLPGFFSPEDSISTRIPVQEEGFIISCLNERNVAIASRSTKGLFNAVWSLLEKLGYGFYLSYDGKPAPNKKLSFKDWEMTDFPLQSERIVFNWHNFLSGCTGWNYEDWCSWIDQSAKMRYNTIMVHAYGNNPMFSFEYNGQKKQVGYLTTSISGRDWGAQHVNDVRRLPGGEVFTGPVFGSDVALVSDEQRGEAAARLMKKVFEHAGEMAMKINFAIDVDTWSANPKNVIESLPPESRIQLKTQDIVNPETADGYLYYKAQIKSLLNSYPQISTITVWVRHERSLWRFNITPDQFPKSWLNEWRQLLLKHPELESDVHSASTFALSKIVLAYQKAIKELKRDDVTVAFGSWRWAFLPSAAILMPENCSLIPLDYNIEFDSDESQKILSKIGKARKLIPIVWAQHDDHHYYGKPYTPYANFNQLLRERNASGFGIIHWTTRPLDLFFKSLADQVWSLSENEGIATTVSNYIHAVFGSQQQELQEYITEWIVSGPMFGRETGEHFFDPGKQPAGKKFEPSKVTIERIQNRIALLKRINQPNLSALGKKMFHYYSAMERFYLSLFQNQDKFYEAYALLDRQRVDSAKLILQRVDPEKTMELYAGASAILPITSGEKGMIVSLGTRWLPDFVNLKQRAKMADICYKFEATQHDTLAQYPGTGTCFIDKQQTLWSCLGVKELKTGVAGNSKGGVLPENSLTYMEIARPFTLFLQTIGKNWLTPGKYKLEIKFLGSNAEPHDCKLFLLTRDNTSSLQTTSGYVGSKLKMISACIEIKEDEEYMLDIEPGNGPRQFTNLIISPRY